MIKKSINNFDFVKAGAKEALEGGKFLCITGDYERCKKALYLSYWEFKRIRDEKRYKWDGDNILIKGTDPRVKRPHKKEIFMQIYPPDAICLDGGHIDMAGCDAADFDKEVLGNCKTFNLSGVVFEKLQEVGSPLAALQSKSRVVVIDNINLDTEGMVGVMKKLRSVLSAIKKLCQDEHGMLILTLEEDLKKLPSGLTDLFKTIDLNDKTKRKKRIADEDFIRLTTRTKKSLKDQSPYDFDMNKLFAEVSRKSKECDPKKKGLTPSTVNTKYYNLCYTKKRIGLNKN
ncbi:MAG: hypothetical protein ACE5KZ_15435 [Candidatus Scalinduaceae bacterium]